MSGLPVVYIIILNWNGWQDTLACVESCRNLSWSNFRILVVDNASSDGSEEILRSQLTDVEIIQSGANLGFAGGNNVGIRKALSSGADYVWLLNNDTVVDTEALSSLVNAMEGDKSVGIAGSKIYYLSDPQRIWSAGGFWDKGKLRLRQRGSNQLEKKQFENLCVIGSINGCSMLVRASLIREIGLLDESYFLYWEDTEWCARAKEFGYKILYVPFSKIWHKVSAKAGSGSFLLYYYSTRNGFRFLKKRDFFLIPYFAFYTYMSAARYLIKGNVNPLKGYFFGLYDFIFGRDGQRKTN